MEPNTEEGPTCSDKKACIVGIVIGFTLIGIALLIAMWGGSL